MFPATPIHAIWIEMMSYLDRDDDELSGLPIIEMVSYLDEMLTFHRFVSLFLDFRISQFVDIAAVDEGPH